MGRRRNSFPGPYIIKQLNLRTLAISLIDEILYLYVHIKNINLFNIKFKNIPQYGNHVLMSHFLEYSRIEMAEVHQHWEALLIFMTQRTHVFLLSFRIIGGNICFFLAEKCDRILALSPPVQISQILQENFSWFPEIGVTVIFSTFRTLKLCVLAFCVCISSPPSPHAPLHKW